MANVKKQCYRCKHLVRFYTKGTTRYKRINYGWCGKKRAVVETRECCDQYSLKHKNKRLDVSLLGALDIILTDISEIRNILQDEKTNEEEMR